ncbi:hypothetical protein INT48_006243 [Thamnidium elegans]|uniref:Spore coat protein CotH n=1 Tax=Thamnidium elegans TaxID=101142 RepID=A0A8H7VPQ7_9FUNG|nr:hypothetical protein INT48_006243 [Thamnidium elegans]
MIDNDKTAYPLSALPETPYIFTGSAPMATIGYKYTAKSIFGKRDIEPFSRAPVINASYNEIYGISMNTYPIPEFPQMYPHLSSINRKNSGLHKDDQIPTLFLSGSKSDVRNIHANIYSKIKINLDLTYIGLSEVHTLNAVEVKISGRGTRFSPKSSYKLDFGKKGSLFGYRRLKLRSLSTDPAYIREKICYDMINSFGLASTGYSFVRVFINNKPYGLFGLQEDFDESWLANEFNNGDQENYNQGTLYTGNTQAILRYLGENETLYESVDNPFKTPTYKIEEAPRKSGEKSAANFQRLIDFTKFLANAPSTEPNAVALWNQQIDTDSVLRSFALELFLGNSDGYIQAATNYNLFTNANQNDQLIFIPSDMDMTLGSSSLFYANTTFYTRFEDHPDFNSSRPLFYNILKVPEFKLIFNGMLASAFKNLDLIYSRINSLSGLIQEDVYYDALIARDYVLLPPFSVGQQLIKVAIKDGQFGNGESFLDYYSRIGKDKIWFEVATNGTINRPSIMGLKQWISISANSYLKANN